MKRRAFLLVSTLAVSGCSGMMPGAGRHDAILQNALAAGEQARNTPIVDGSDALLDQVMNEPDLPQWYEQREKIAFALGDRTLNRSFDRVFDSLTVALSNLGSRVTNMERQSGYIAASIPDLGPQKSKALHGAAMRQYAAAKGFSPLLADGPELASVSNSMMRGAAGLTASLVRQSPTQTKVKLRFDNVYYPGMINEYYQLVWAAVDKQMFLDQSLD